MTCLILLGAALIVAGVITYDPLSVIFGGGCIAVAGIFRRN